MGKVARASTVFIELMHVPSSHAGQITLIHRDVADRLLGVTSRTKANVKQWKSQCNHVTGQLSPPMSVDLHFNQNQTRNRFVGGFLAYLGTSASMGLA